MTTPIINKFRLQLYHTNYKFKNLSIFKKLSSTYIIAILIPSLVMGIYTLHQNNNNTKEQITYSTKIAMEQVGMNISNKLEIVQVVADSLANSSMIINFFSNDFSYIYENYYTYSHEVKSVVTEAVNLNRVNIGSLRVYFNNNTIPEGWSTFYNVNNINKYSWYDNLNKKLYAQPFWLYTDNENMHRPETEGTNTRCFTYIRPINDANGYNIGVIVIDIWNRELFTALNASNEGQLLDFHYMVFDMENKDFIQIDKQSKSHNEKIRQKLLENGQGEFTLDNQIYSLKSIPQINIVILSSLSLDKVLRKPRYNNFLFISAIFCGIVFLELSTYYLIRLILSKFKQILHIINIVSTGDFSQRIPVDSCDEVGQLAKNFNVLINKIDQLFKGIIAAETSKRNTHLMALQAQINPHFILNTLEIFRSKMELVQQYAIADMVSDFGKLLSYNIYSSNIYVKISEEFNYIKRYYRLQKLRYEERIQLNMNMPQLPADYYIIRFILQPIVENSIKHGLSTNTKRLNINISAHMDGGCIIIIIEDDGKGIDKDTLDQLNDGFGMPIVISQKPETTKIGLSNINKRLKLFYNNTSYLKVESEPYKFTRVIITIPAQDESGDINV